MNNTDAQNQAIHAKSKALQGKKFDDHDHKKYGSVMKGRSAEQLANYQRDSKHYRGNTNSEGGIPFGRKPK